MNMNINMNELRNDHGKYINNYLSLNPDEKN